MLDFAATCVFAKQSLGPILCGLPKLGCAWHPHLGRLPFSRSYGDMLPSSFSTDHSSTLGFSPRLPVSVYGTVGPCTPARGFSWRPASRTLDEQARTRHPVSPLSGGICLPAQATPLHRDVQHPTALLLPRPPLRSNAHDPARDSWPVSHHLRLSASA